MTTIRTSFDPSGVKASLAEFGTPTGDTADGDVNISGQFLINGTAVVPISAQSGFFFAELYGGTWDATHDVGAAINAAIAAAAAAGGGTVILPAGTYGLSTPIVNNTTGVRLQGQGVGVNIDNASGSIFLAVTKLSWIGAADATMLLVQPAGSVSLYDCGVVGITLEGNSLAAVCAKFVQVSYSTIDIGVSEPRTTGAWFTTMSSAFTDPPGTQNNEIWVQSRVTSATYAATGILFDCGASSSYNCSFNRIHNLNAVFNKGDGIVFGASDNNWVLSCASLPTSATSVGTPMVWANRVYTMPNGVTVGGEAYDSLIAKSSSSGVVQGYQTGSTITAGVGNVGSAAINTITLATSATTAVGSATLTFTSTTGILAGLVANAGRWSSGIPPNVPIASITATTAVMGVGAVKAVGSALNVIFSYGFTTSAVTGTYTMTCVDATHWDLTAPSGGHSQSNIAISGGIVTFTDMVIPLTGTPTAADTFTIVVPAIAKNIQFANHDKANSSPDPFFENGSRGYINTTQQPFPVPQGGVGDITIRPVNGSLNSVNIGGQGNGVGATAFAGANIGGAGNTVTGFGAAVYGGHNNSVTGTYGFAHNDSNLSGGTASEVGGYNCTDRNRYASWTWGAKAFSVQGDCQVAMQPLSAATTDATVTRMTADRAAASTVNTMNLANRSTYRISLEVTAHQTGGAAGTRDDSAMWTAVVLVKRGAAAANTAFVGGYYMAITTLANTAVVAGTGFTPTIADAAAAAWTITLNVDTTNGGLSVSGTGEANKNIEWLCRCVSVEVVN